MSLVTLALVLAAMATLAMVDDDRPFHPTSLAPEKDAYKLTSRGRRPL